MEMREKIIIIEYAMLKWQVLKEHWQEQGK
jgi:hypothetical protein